MTVLPQEVCDLVARLSATVIVTAVTITRSPVFGEAGMDCVTMSMLLWSISTSSGLFCL